MAELLADAARQRCYVHFLRNALDHLARKTDDDCLQEAFRGLVALGRLGRESSVAASIAFKRFCT